MEGLNSDNTQSRLYRFIAFKGMSARAFQSSVGLSVSYVHNMTKRRISQPIINRIAAQYPDLNIEWLQNGVGEMLNTAHTVVEPEESKDNSVPLLPICAQAGILSDFEHSAMEYECEKILSPISDAELAITITGESMTPEYPNGSKVLIKKINENAFIDWGHTYVLDTCNGIVVKNVFPGTAEETVKCVSVNPDFPPYEIMKSDIRSWYRVLMCLSLK